MTEAPPPSNKLATTRQAGKLLHSLLRSPKTRAGLIAAVSGSGVSKNFVYGWLSAQLRTGAVVALKSSRPLSYQIARHAVTERPAEGLYPSWLEPRTLPDTTQRIAYYDGKSVTTARMRAKQ